jgi:rhodanese-related sulfurtransferase
LCPGHGHKGQPSFFRIVGAIAFLGGSAIEFKGFMAKHLEQVPQEQPSTLNYSMGYRTGIGVMALQLLGYDNVEGYPPSYVGWQQAQ